MSMENKIIHIFERGGTLGEKNDLTIMGKFYDMIYAIAKDKERFLDPIMCEIKIREDRNDSFMYLYAQDMLQAILIITRSEFNNHHYNFIDFGRTWKDYPSLVEMYKTKKNKDKNL